MLDSSILALLGLSLKQGENILILLSSGALCHGSVDSIDLVRRTVVINTIFFRKHGEELPRSSDFLTFRNEKITQVHVVTSSQELEASIRECEELAKTFPVEESPRSAPVTPQGKVASSSSSSPASPSPSQQVTARTRSVEKPSPSEKTLPPAPPAETVHPLCYGPVSLRVTEKISVYQLVDNEESLSNAIKELEGQTVLGLNCEGVSLGRKGKLCLLQLATPTNTYIFDISTLQFKAFRSGLKIILESSSILKITHDARSDSDALYHQFQVVLTNTFDTQVADVFVRRGVTQSMPRFLTSYAQCLRVYLGFTMEDTNVKAVRREMFQMDPEIYDKRPLSESTLQQVAFDVCFLHDLRDSLQKLMSMEFQITCEHFLKTKRNLSDLEVEKYEETNRGTAVGDNFVPQQLLEARFRQATSSRKPDSSMKRKGERSAAPVLEPQEDDNDDEADVIPRVPSVVK